MKSAAEDLVKFVGDVVRCATSSIAVAFVQDPTPPRPRTTIDDDE
jgi:hypothetical protein